MATSVDESGRLQQVIAGFERRRLARVLNVEDARRLARRTLPRGIFEYIDGGSGDEISLRRNRDALRAITFCPRMASLEAVPRISTTLFGQQLSMPVLTAPCGGLKLIHPDADVGVARAAADAGVVHVTSSSSSGLSLEDIAAAVAAPKWFQLYRFYGREGLENLVGRVIAAGGYSVMAVTLDTTVVGRRERDHRNGFSYSMRVNARNAVKLGPQLARRPFWVGRYVRDGMPFEVANSARMKADRVPLALTEMGHNSSLTPTWDEIAWIREVWKGPLVIKGVMSTHDAKRAVDAGADGVIVSNHGGRQLDGLPASVEVLPSVVEAVGNKIPVLVDSGIRRGADVVKALALGARAVLIGRPYIWGLALGGQAGVARILELLRTEMTMTLQLLGCAGVEELDERLIAAPPTAATHRA